MTENKEVVHTTAYTSISLVSNITQFFVSFDTFGTLGV